MYICRKNFSGIVSGSEGQIVEIKDKAVAQDLLDAGYIEENSDKSKNTTELKKEIESLKKDVVALEKENESLKTELAEAKVTPEAPVSDKTEKGNTEDNKTPEVTKK